MALFCNGDVTGLTRVSLVAAVDLDLFASNVQDAFVIAVEQQARERLERLSALKRIKPIDMTKLSEQVITPSWRELIATLPIVDAIRN